MFLRILSLEGIYWHIVFFNIISFSVENIMSNNLWMDSAYFSISSGVL